MSESITTGERYAHATQSSHLRMDLEKRCDADSLLAAGYAAANNPRKSLALTVYRMQVTRDLSQLHSVLIECNSWMHQRMTRKGNRPIPASQRHELVTETLKWWLNPTCGYCEGRMFEVVEGTPTLSTVTCLACDGTGRKPIKRVLPGPLVQYGLWLAKELDILAADVIGDMAALLRDDVMSI